MDLPYMLLPQDPPLFQGYVLGNEYHLHDDMWPASPAAGTYNGGITPVGRQPDTRGVIVLAKVGTGRYENHWEDGDLIFSGEDNFRGLGKQARFHDQTLTGGANGVLFRQSELGYPLYLFWKPSERERYTYAGLGEVVRADLVPRDGRLVAVFRLRPLNVAHPEERRELERAVAVAFEGEADEVSEEPQRRMTAVTVRDRAFARRVKLLYGDACAVCGQGRRDARGNPEVETAHVMPKEYGGPDSPRNALSLCRFHHWAFDGLLFVVDDDWRVRACNGGGAIQGVAEFDGRLLRVLPEKTFLRPQPQFLEARRKLAEGAMEKRSASRAKARGPRAAA